jgi:hypothetical protein
MEGAYQRALNFLITKWNSACNQNQAREVVQGRASKCERWASSSHPHEGFRIGQVYSRSILTDRLSRVLLRLQESRRSSHKQWPSSITMPVRLGR